MASEARKSFDANLEDIKRLLELHTMVGAPKKADGIDWKF
jgi:hypothetical protein